MRTMRRIRTIVTSNLNELIEKAENPEKILKQSIADMQESLARAKTQLAASIAGQKKLERSYRRHETEATTWEQNATEAVQNGNEDQAREALKMKVFHARVAQELKEEWTRQGENLRAVKGSLNTLEARIDGAKRKKDLLIVRKKLAEAKRDIHQSIAGLADKTAFIDMAAFEAFDGMEDRVLSLETQAEAAVEMSVGTLTDATDRPSQMISLNDIATNAEVEDELASLKAKLGEEQEE